MTIIAQLALMSTILALPIHVLTASFIIPSGLTKTPTNVVEPRGTVALGWIYTACFTDEINARALQNPVQLIGGPGTMTVEACNYRCEVDGYLLSGVEFGQECWCDHALNGEYHFKVDDSECSMKCSGDSAQSCGGSNKIAIYEYSFIEVSIVAIERLNLEGSGHLDARSADAVMLYTPIGCYVDSVTTRMLRNYTVSPETAKTMNVGACTAACYDMAFPYAGLEYGQECFCDDLMQTIVKAPEADCDMSCAGDNREICGGNLRINIYSYNGPKLKTTTTTSTSVTTPTGSAVAMSRPGSYISLGCYSDTASNRTLRIVGDFPGAKEAGMSIVPCQDACQDAGYVFAGVEFAKECWCDNVIQGLGIPALQSDCDMPCTGNNSEICGGRDRINIYRLMSTSISTSTTTIALTTTLISPMTTDTATPVTGTPSIASITSALSPTTLPTICSEYYIVSQGDYCYSIWTSFKISQDQFMSWNPSLIFPQCKIFPGDVLCVGIGAGPTVTVLTLPEISALSSGSISSISSVTMTSVNTLTFISIQVSTFDGSNTISTSAVVSSMTGSSCRY